MSVFGAATARCSDAAVFRALDQEWAFQARPGSGRHRDDPPRPGDALGLAGIDHDHVDRRPTR